MIAISWYILKVLIVSGILSGYYYIALKDKIFHRWNRFYLLITVMLSMLLPLVKISIFNLGADQGNIARALQTITLQDEIVIELGRKSAFNSNMLITYGYVLISLFLIATLISTLLKIRRIKNKYPLTGSQVRSPAVCNFSGSLCKICLPWSKSGSHAKIADDSLTKR